MFTTDTRQDHCPIRIVYSSAPTSNDVHATELHDKCWVTTMRPVAIIKATEFGDYSLMIEHRSNLRQLIVWANDIEHFNFVHVIGHNGYQALGYDATLGPVPDNEDLVDILAMLEDGESVDSDDVCALEDELVAAAWDDHGRDDFIRALSDTVDELDPGFHHISQDDDSPLPSEVLKALNKMQRVNTTPATWGQFWHDLYEVGCELMSVDHHVVDSSSISFQFDEWVDGLSEWRSYPGHEFVNLVRTVAEHSRDGLREPVGADEVG